MSKRAASSGPGAVQRVLPVSRELLLGWYACGWAIGESALTATWALITYRLRTGKIDPQSQRGRRLKGVRDTTGLLALIAILFLILPAL
jgi:hypothetical protein